MSLPGKFCIGILEEDNPLKSYFRFKPLLVAEEGRYVPFSEPDTYPQDSCIRIVPDKNEAYHFKARMRRMGLFCVVDLRAHPDENDKIRPNKNYREDGPERNAFIIYSDVVKEPAPGLILELLPESMADRPCPMPRTAQVLLKGEELLPERLSWEPLPDDETIGALKPTGELCPLDRAQLFDLPTFGEQTVAFAILPPPEPDPVPAPRPVDAAHRPAEPLRAPQEVATPRAPIPQPVAEPHRPDHAPADAKPWIHHDDSMLPRPVDPRLSPAQRSLAAQSGLNPRRGRSLQELIDEKWQQSRLNQLGQPVTPIHTGAPVASPIDRATRAVREVWLQPQLRRDLLQSLRAIDEFGASLDECREAARREDIERHLEGLEARRLALLGEIDHLNLKNAEVRRSLKDELRRDEAGSLAEAVGKTRAAQAEQAKYERLAQEARAAAEDARAAVDRLTDEELERHLTRFALDQHMLERIGQLRGEAEAVPPAAPALEQADLNALADRLIARFDAAGHALSRMDALNLCACAVVSPALILSGPVGCGKTETARLLADALGWTAPGRAVAFAPGDASLAEDARLDALDALPDTPALLLLDDANLRAAADPLRGLDTRLRPAWRLCLTVQDGGAPLPAHALDRGFTVRLAPAADAPWRPRAPVAWEAPAPADPRLPLPEADLPAAAEARMATLRQSLAKRGATLSRRALDDAWRYCALMLSALGEDADPIDVLDRAVAQRLLPTLLATAPLPTLAALPALLEGLPRSRALLSQPLPILL